MIKFKKSKSDVNDKFKKLEDRINELDNKMKVELDKTNNKITTSIHSLVDQMNDFITNTYRTHKHTTLSNSTKTSTPRYF